MYFKTPTWHKLAEVKEIEKTKIEKYYDLTILMTDFYFHTRCDQNNVIKIDIDENYGGLRNEFYSFSLFGVY